MTNKLSEFKTWDDYQSEAEHEPFILPVSEDQQITIKAPTGHQITQFNQAARRGDPEAMLIMLCGDAWDDIEPLVSKASHKVAEALMVDLMNYFDLAEEITLVGPSVGDRPGSVKVEKDPRKIGQLINAGWRPMGEAVSRT